MLKIFCFILNCLGNIDEPLELSEGALLIYTDTRIENLNFIYKGKDKRLENITNLKEMTESYSPCNFLMKSHVYSLTLPDEDKGEIYCEIKDDNKKESLRMLATFQRVVNNNTKKYYISQLGSEMGSGKNDLNIYESNYTYIFNESESRIIFVIGETLEKKIQLDKSLEFHFFKNFSFVGGLCHSLLLENYDCLKFLRSNTKFFNMYQDKLNNFMYGLIFRIVHIYSTIESFEILYKSSFYESNIVRNIGSGFLRTYIYNAFSLFFHNCKFTYLEGLPDIEKMYNRYCKYKKKEDFKPFSEWLQVLSNSFTIILKILNKKDNIEEEYVQKRDDMYFNFIRERKKVIYDPQIENLRANFIVLCDFFYIRNFIRISKFVEHYVKIIFSNKNKEESEEKISKGLELVTNEIKGVNSIIADLSGLFTNEPEEFLKNLSNNQIFKDLTLKSIDKNLKE